jgi:hypothetical protein
MFTSPTLAIITGGYYVDIYPLNNIDNNTPIEFEIRGSKDEYIDHGKMFFHVIVDDGSNNISNTRVCAPVNNLAHSGTNKCKFYSIIHR